MANSVTVTYYEEFTDDSRTWRSPQPDFDLESFQTELRKRTGRRGDLDRFRIRWAGNLDEYSLEEFDIQTGWVYRDNGQEIFVDIKNLTFEFPDGAITAPFYEHLTVFTPRFVVEELREDGFYHKAWFVEYTTETKDESGRIDAVSRYREPSERDLRMAEHLRYLRDTLTSSDIEKGLQAQKELEERRKALSREELVDEMAEEFTQAITDGITPKKDIDFSKEFSPQYIKEYTQALIEAHNG